MAVWRGVWDYSHVWLEGALCQGDASLANILALLGGLLVSSIIDLYHGDLARHVGDVGGVRLKVARHVFSLTWGFADIMMWRGLWEGYDLWAGEGLLQSVVTSVLGLALLSTTNSLKSAQSSPVRARGRFQKFVLGKLVAFSLKWVDGVPLVHQGKCVV